MSVNDLSYQDYLDRINIQEVLLHAGYTLNRRDGMRYPSFVRIGSDGCRIHGDKFIVTQNGNTCFRPPEQKSYNVISLIKSFPSMFKEHVGSSNPDHLVNEVCRNILNIPSEERQGRIIEPRKEQKPFDLNNYTIHAFRKYDFEGIKKFYPFFITRGISLDTQKAFGAHFILTTKESLDGGKNHTNLSFPLYVPGNTNVVGLEERGYPRLDGSSGYKGKALGSNSSEGLWIAALGKQDLSDATDVYWFESGYDAMSYYQLHVKDNPSLEKAVFVSTGGNPTVGQMQRMLAVTPSARHHICFDNDLAGRQFTENLKGEIHRIALSSVVVTPERKPYLDSIPLSQDFAKGNMEMLPKPLQDKYAKYESAWEESMSMRQSRLCYEGDIREQENLTKKLYQEYRDSVRDFLGIDPQKITPFVRETPERGKDWNEQVLLEQEDSLKAAEEEEETRSVASGIDLDADGDIEINESEEKKRIHFFKR